MRCAAALAIALCLPAAAHAAPRWTFCVAAADGGTEVWISDVFAAEGTRERLEGAFKSVVERIGASKANAQCPQPRDDRTVAVNAQFAAEAFNRKMGANLHAVPASEFPAGRQASHEPPSRGKRGNPKLQDDLPVGSNPRRHQDEQ
ncbi:MAG TPA: hypothetical protein VJY34_09600 [Roseiarcus sp.]|nr:hypothetical protein [Roseiarcus sp.]